jgi:acetyl esterase/lipase
MSAVFALMNNERGGVDRRAPVLLHPVADADFDTPSSLQFAEGYYLTRDGMKWFWDASTTDAAQRTEVYASPLHASLDQLRGLPIILVITDEADVLCGVRNWRCGTRSSPKPSGRTPSPPLAARPPRWTG